MKDQFGEHYKTESGTGGVAVKGSYGFRDSKGLSRHVDYVADKGGFRASIKTNEPGTVSQNPADTTINSPAHPYFGTHGLHKDLVNPLQKHSPRYRNSLPGVGYGKNVPGLGYGKNIPGLAYGKNIPGVGYSRRGYAEEWEKFAGILSATYELFSRTFGRKGYSSKFGHDY